MFEAMLTVITIVVAPVRCVSTVAITQNFGSRKLWRIAARNLNIFSWWKTLANWLLYTANQLG